MRFARRDVLSDVGSRMCQLPLAARGWGVVMFCRRERERIESFSESGVRVIVTSIRAVIRLPPWPQIACSFKLEVAPSCLLDMLSTESGNCHAMYVDYGIPTMFRVLNATAPLASQPLELPSPNRHRCGTLSTPHTGIRIAAPPDRMAIWHCNSCLASYLAPQFLQA